MGRIAIIALSGILLLLLIICLLIPRARKYFCYTYIGFLKELWGIVGEETPSKKKGIKSVPCFLLVIIISMTVTVLFAIILIVPIPIVCIIYSLKYPEMIDKRIELDKELDKPISLPPKKTPEEIAEENRRWEELFMATHFTVDSNLLQYDPDEKEIIFYTPQPDPNVENAIASNYLNIKDVFNHKGYNFVFLPEYNTELGTLLNNDVFKYHSPSTATNIQVPAQTLDYRDIKEALQIPERVDGPCFIRCKNKDRCPVVFSFFKIDLTRESDILTIVGEYLKNIGGNNLYSILSDDTIRNNLVGKPADDRFDSDVYLIGKEIRDRLDLLRAKGLSTLAIRKLIGDDSDKPGKLLIDKHKKLILVDYGNKEIKLEPLHKAVFFLFLRHPEGIYFKDLKDYKNELGAIYREITGRDDITGIEDSIDKLTDPYNNSINEKCARIKNAFVSEFREEVAQWYFIDGKRGERKSIKIPRELVTWEIVD